MRIRWSGLHPVNLRLTDKFATRQSLTNLKSLRIVQADVSFRLPLAFILVKGVEVPCRIV